MPDPSTSNTLSLKGFVTPAEVHRKTTCSRRGCLITVLRGCLPVLKYISSAVSQRCWFFCGIISSWLRCHFPGTASEIWVEIFWKALSLKRIYQEISCQHANSLWTGLHPSEMGEPHFLCRKFLKITNTLCRSIGTSLCHTNRHSNLILFIIRKFFDHKILQNSVWSP